MPKTIQQSVTLPAPADHLYRMYLDPKRHAAITGAPVRIGARPGSLFRAFNGALSGKVLFTRPGWMIIQSWRSTGLPRKTSTRRSSSRSGPVASRAASSSSTSTWRTAMLAG
jgi:activator of HSP90 ATPase